MVRIYVVLAVCKPGSSIHAIHHLISYLLICILLGTLMPFRDFACTRERNNKIVQSYSELGSTLG